MASADGAPLLQLEGLTMRFGGVIALSEVDLKVEEGEIFALIGPNGAGKTTVFNVVTGVFKPSSGGVRFEGRSIVNRKQHQITRLGVARTFQNIRLFADMTALENRTGGRRRSPPHQRPRRSRGGCCATAGRRPRGSSWPSGCWA
jgi:branched-chain amino acid transport system ATP-binding protein